MGTVRAAAAHHQMIRVLFLLNYQNDAPWAVTTFNQLVGKESSLTEQFPCDDDIRKIFNIL